MTLFGQFLSGRRSDFRCCSGLSRVVVCVVETVVLVGFTIAASSKAAIKTTNETPIALTQGWTGRRRKSCTANPMRDTTLVQSARKDNKINKSNITISSWATPDYYEETYNMD